MKMVNEVSKFDREEYRVFRRLLTLTSKLWDLEVWISSLFLINGEVLSPVDKNWEGLGFLLGDWKQKVGGEEKKHSEFAISVFLILLTHSITDKSLSFSFSLFSLCLFYQNIISLPALTDLNQNQLLYRFSLDPISHFISSFL